MSAAGPVSEGERLVSVAVVGGVPVGVLVVRDRDRSAGDAERMAIEHATTVLAMELARRQILAQSDVRLRTGLVLDLGGGADRATLVNRPRLSVTISAGRAGSYWCTRPAPTARPVRSSRRSAGRPGPPGWARCWRRGGTT
jgi:hypothetical protein